MKKYILIAALACIAGTACSKIDNDIRREVTFEVANRLQTKADGVKYNNGAFGTYAWFNGTDEFMVNEQVNLAASVWKTIDHTFYWPKTGNIEFISYSPFVGTSDVAGSVPAVTKTSIAYTDYTVGTTDLMYADKAKCSSNVNEITDDATPESGYSGVPTLFRHALAKLSFKVKANFTEWTDASNGAVTKWEVTVNSAKISGFYTTGSCNLTLNADGKTWDKPAGNVWTSPSGATPAQELISTPVVLTTTAQDIAPATGFVLPQTLADGVQKLDLQVHIKTTLSNGKVIEEDFNDTLNLKDISSRPAWEMNQNIVYTINFKPTATESDFDSPEDVTITFDPAVADWENVAASATIQI
ncbi:MAG: fimbrillin family protein [Bacteroidales bacterium]|nr:fimbrillin family protein [Bacteroidales bacterium]